MTKEYIINFGLFKKDMRTPLDKQETLKSITEKLNSIGIEGFSSDFSFGSWKGQIEESLSINFVNSFNIQEDTLKIALSELKDSFEQESILLRSREIDYTFI